MDTLFVHILEASKPNKRTLNRASTVISKTDKAPSQLSYTVVGPDPTTSSR